MHPIERLRYVARTEGAEPGLVAREAAAALAAVAREDGAGVLPACRRLVNRHLTAGPVWWLSARVLSAPEPDREARAAATELAADATDACLAESLPDEATVLVIGWPDLTASALRARGDIEVLVVDAGGDGTALCRRLDNAGNDVMAVPDAGAAAAAATADLVVVEATAAGPSGLLATLGSHAAAAVAADAGVPVWAVTGVGRVLPDRLWAALLERFDADDEPWERDYELVPAGVLSAVLGPSGEVAPADGLEAASCPAAPELFRDAG